MLLADPKYDHKTLICNQYVEYVRNDTGGK